MRASILLIIVVNIFCSNLFAQSVAEGKISGVLTTQDGKPAEAVTILLKDTKLKTFSDENGNYSFSNIPAGNYVLITSFVGTLSQSVPVSLAEQEQKVINFKLKENAEQLKEVIIASGASMNQRNMGIGKLPISIKELPQSATIIGEALIKNQQSQRLSDVIKNVNGVYLGSTRGGVQETFYARGYNLGAYNMFKNGARVNTGVMPEMSSLEKVEVLKGSAAILYGNVAPGGIINLVTKRPKFDAGGEVSFRAGSYNLYKPNFDVYGPISNTVAYRVNGTYETANSYRDEVSSKRYYINPSFLFKLNSKTDLIIQGDYLYSKFTSDFGIGSILSEPNKIANLPRNAFLGTSWQYNKAQQSTTSANIQHRFSESWSFNGNLSYQQFDRDYYSTERVQIQTNGDFYRPLNKIVSRENYYTAQADITGRFKTGGIKHVVLAGADAERYLTSTYAFTNPTVYDTINIYDNTKYQARTDIPVADKKTLLKSPINRYGVYVQDLIMLSPKFNLLAGVRWSLQEALAPTTYYLQKGDSSTKGAYKADRAFSPRFGVVYKPRNSTAIFVSYASSFTPNTGTDIYFKPLSPSIIDQYEAGIKNDFFQGRLTANLTLYYIRNNNLAQTAQYDSAGRENSNTSIKELVGQTGSKGVEIDFAYNPASNLVINAGYSYNDMRYIKTPGTVGSFIVGERLVNTPQHTANGSVFYTFNNLALKGLKIGASVFYTGKRYAGWNNTIGQSQNYSRLMPVDAFTTVDISAGYTYKRLSLLAKLSNITNTFNYIVHENYSVNPIAPRQVVATVAYRF